MAQVREKTVEPSAAEKNKEFKLDANFKAKTTLSWPTLIFRGLVFLVWHFCMQTMVWAGLFRIHVDEIHRGIYQFYVMFLGANYLRVRGSHAIERANLVDPKDRVMYCPNHRSWGDFFIDAAILGYRSTFLSRMAVAIALPATFPLGRLAGAAYFFLRNSSPASKRKVKSGSDDDAAAAAAAKAAARAASIERSNSILDKAYEPWHAVTMYPEGTRLRGPKPGKMRTGALRYAFSRGIRVQCVISTNKEVALDEVCLRFERGVDVITAVGPVLRPSDFREDAAYKGDAKAAEEAFIAAVIKSFAETWDKAYNAKAADCDPVDIWAHSLTEGEKSAVRGSGHGRFAMGVSMAAWVVGAAVLARLTM